MLSQQPSRSEQADAFARDVERVYKLAAQARNVLRMSLGDYHPARVQRAIRELHDVLQDFSTAILVLQSPEHVESSAEKQQICADVLEIRKIQKEIKKIPWAPSENCRLSEDKKGILIVERSMLGQWIQGLTAWTSKEYFHSLGEKQGEHIIYNARLSQIHAWNSELLLRAEGYGECMHNILVKLLAVARMSRACGEKESPEITRLQLTADALQELLDMQREVRLEEVRPFLARPMRIPKDMYIPALETLHTYADHVEDLVGKAHDLKPFYRDFLHLVMLGQQAIAMERRLAICYVREQEFGKDREQGLLKVQAEAQKTYEDYMCALRRTLARDDDDLSAEAMESTLGSEMYAPLQSFTFDSMSFEEFRSYFV